MRHLKHSDAREKEKPQKKPHNLAKRQYEAYKLVLCDIGGQAPYMQHRRSPLGLLGVRVGLEALTFDVAIVRVHEGEPSAAK